MKNNLIQSLAILLTNFSSVTNTTGERDFVPFLNDVLSSWDYFKAHPKHLWPLQTLDDSLERYSLFALVKGNSNKTIILTGHYDTVSTDNYGMLEPLACEPQKLLEVLIADLQKNQNNPQALQDFESGDFLPGRGMLDMKSGLAVGLAVLEAWSNQKEIPANLLFIAVPDEEVASHGMKSVAQHLPEICKAHDLDLELAINLDVSTELAIFLGSVGKLLPFVLFVGRPSHVGAPFDGVNPAFLAAEFTKRIEANPEYGDDKIEPPAPPTVLYHRDNRTHYDVTTPASVFCAVNMLTHQRSPQDVLESFKQLAKESLESSLHTLQERAEKYSQKNNAPANFPNWTVTVITFADLLEKAKKVDAEQVEKILLETVPNAESINRCNDITQALVKLANIEGPTAIVGFSPPYYSRVEFDHTKDQHILEVIEQELEDLKTTFSPSPFLPFSSSSYHSSTNNKESSALPSVRPFFDGISDMSFFNPADGVEPQQFVASQMPIKQTIFESKLNCPIINIGPWGRDYHQKLERVHTPYAFEFLPMFLWNLINRLLAHPELP
jgi:arginine utilization protein RocB